VEGQALRDRAHAFRAAACIVLGISFDTPAENKLFAEAQEFGFPLLSDVDRAVGRRYDVLRDADDQYAEFPRRISYLIDPAGVIRRAYVVADVAAHADEVLADLAALGASR
jgi:thioredoxin-dependent peroxiredoxin